MELNTPPSLFLRLDLAFRQPMDGERYMETESDRAETYEYNW